MIGSIKQVWNERCYVVDGLILGDEAPSLLRTPHSKRSFALPSKSPTRKHSNGVWQASFLQFRPFKRACTFALSEFHSEVTTSRTYHTSRFRAIERKVLGFDLDPGYPRYVGIGLLRSLRPLFVEATLLEQEMQNH